MLPYSPLHHLLLADAGGAARDDERQRLRRAHRVSRRRRAASSGVRSRTCICMHDRRIETRADDSVARVADERPRCLAAIARLRARAGAAAGRVRSRPILACGARVQEHLLPRAGADWPASAPTSATWRTTRLSAPTPEGIEHSRGSSAASPALVAHDLHPEYLSTKYARGTKRRRAGGVPAPPRAPGRCLAEHRESGPAVAAIFDGTGVGDRRDGVGRGAPSRGTPPGSSERGHLHAVRMPGGERGSGEPWRMACSWLPARRSRRSPHYLPCSPAG